MAWPERTNSDSTSAQQGQDTGPSDIDPETAARRRSRLERRITNLEYDIQRASSADQPGSRWRRRIDEIGDAIEQAQADVAKLVSDPDPSPAFPVDPAPITAIDVKTDIPATVRFTIGSEDFRYSEEVDWTERGEQRSLPGLRRFEGDPEALVPVATPEDRREALSEHLRHALGALAIGLRDGAVEEPENMTLADLATPCPICGNWRDHRNRCIDCQRREWKANEVRSEINRLVDERNTLLEEMASQREALPILQRQLQDARRELEKYTTDENE